MKKITILTLFFLTSSLYANDWQKAYPVFDIGNAYVGSLFSKAYVQYRLVDDGKTMEIDLHDQVVRSGYFWDRMFHEKLGTWTRKAPLFVDNEMLLRVLSLVSGIQTEIEENLDAWWLFANFVLLDSMLVSDKEAVAIAFESAHPTVTKITFTTENRGHLYKIGDVTYDDEAFEDWSTQFSARGVELDAN